MLSASSSPQSNKREREEDDEIETPPHVEVSKELIKAKPNPVILSSSRRATSPVRNSTRSLSETGTSTPEGLRRSPITAPTTLNGIVQPPKKRVKLTIAERDEQRTLKAARDKERADVRAQRDLEKRAKEVEKIRRDAEKEVERRKKDAEREEKLRLKEVERAEKEEKKGIKDAEKAEKDKEKRAKEDEKRRKDEERQKIEEEKRRKAKSQPKLNAFFKTPAAIPSDGRARMSPSPAPGAATQSMSASITRSPCKLDNVPEYQKRFPPFFVQKNVKIAPFTQFGRDEHSANRLQDSIDSYILGQRSPDKRRPFDSARLFNQSYSDVTPRGKKVTTVRKIISQILGNAERPVDLTMDTQNNQIKSTRNLLQKVPYKILSFAEDVRPPYKGTYTSTPMAGMQRMARNPTRRDLPNVNYNYDSEAEWEDEDGEDIESDCNDDEDLGDGGEDLEEFLDDAEAESLNARKLVMQGDLEPSCSGMCWEDQERRGPNVKMYRYLMEIITEDAQIRTPIDPFATHYWGVPSPAGLMEPPRMPLNTMKLTSVGLNGPNNKAANFLNPDDGNKPASHGSSNTQRSKKLVPAEDMLAFKKAINGSDLSKLGLIEVLNKQFPKILKSTIKYSLETIATRVGDKEAQKRWALVEETKR